MALSRRQGAMATWLITAECSGARGAAYLNREWIARPAVRSWLHFRFRDLYLVPQARADQGGVKIGEAERAGRSAGSGLGEGQQEQTRRPGRRNHQGSWNPPTQRDSRASPAPQKPTSAEHLMPADHGCERSRLTYTKLGSGKVIRGVESPNELKHVTDASQSAERQPCPKFPYTHRLQAHEMSRNLSLCTGDEEASAQIFPYT